jgi:membrane protease YdiL (CAAX protease family)
MSSGPAACRPERSLSIFLPFSVLGVLVGYLAAWVYDRSRSVLVAMLMHASLTASVLVLDPAGITGTALLMYLFALAAATWMTVAIVAVGDGWHRPQQRLPGASHKG